jgi:hypothetical protein
MCLIVLACSCLVYDECYETTCCFSGIHPCNGGSVSLGRRASRVADSESAYEGVGRAVNPDQPQVCLQRRPWPPVARRVGHQPLVQISFNVTACRVDSFSRHQLPRHWAVLLFEKSSESDFVNVPVRPGRDLRARSVCCSYTQHQTSILWISCI